MILLILTLRRAIPILQNIIIHYEWRDNRFTEYLINTPKIDSPEHNRTRECIFKYINEKDSLYKSFWQPEIYELNKVENIDTFDEFKYAKYSFLYLGR